MAPKKKSAMSRRALFGLGLTRALDELPAIPGSKRDQPELVEEEAEPQRSWGDLRETSHGTTPDPLADQLTAVAEMVVDAGGVAPDRDVLVIGAEGNDVARIAADRGGTITAAPDVEALPFRDDAFDCVLSAFGVVYAERRLHALAEIFRVTRLGGFVSLATWKRSGFMGQWFGLAAQHALPDGSPDPTGWGGAQRMRRDLELYTSEHVGFEPHVARLEFASGAEAWTTFSSLPGPVAVAIGRMDEDQRAAMEQDFLAMLPVPDADGRVDMDARLQLIAARSF